MYKIINTYKRQIAIESVKNILLIVHLVFAREATVKFGVIKQRCKTKQNKTVW